MRMSFSADVQRSKKDKSGRNAPPTEEERAALRLAKEQEKLAKAQAKAAANNLSPEELKARQQAAVSVTPNGVAPSGSGQKTVCASRGRGARS